MHRVEHGAAHGDERRSSMNKTIARTKEELERDTKAALETLYRVRDEIRVRVHLAGLEAKDLYAKLEPKIDEVEQMAKEASAQTVETIQALTKKLEKLVASIGKPS